jgi:hypothetical protein
MLILTLLIYIDRMRMVSVDSIDLSRFTVLDDIRNCSFNVDLTV